MLRTLKAVGMKGKSLGLINNYFSERTEKVVIGATSGEEKASERGVLQGSGLSPVFFLLYFLRSCYAIRTCEWCKEQLQLKSKERERECNDCGTSCVYADDLNAIGLQKLFNTKVLEESIKN